MQPHIEQRAEQIVREHTETLQQKVNEAMEAQREVLHKTRAERAALADLLAELVSVQDISGWANARPHLRGDVQKALLGHYSSNDNLKYALDLLGRVVSGWEGGFTLDMDTLADIRAFLKNVEV
jgi:hypothetical protein